MRFAERDNNNNNSTSSLKRSTKEAGIIRARTYIMWAVLYSRGRVSNYYYYMVLLAGKLLYTPRVSSSCQKGFRDFRRKGEQRYRYYTHTFFAFVPAAEWEKNPLVKIIIIGPSTR